jgi:hypothetical protein
MWRKVPQDGALAAARDRISTHDNNGDQMRLLPGVFEGVLESIVLF